MFVKKSLKVRFINNLWPACHSSRMRIEQRASRLNAQGFRKVAGAGGARMPADDVPGPSGGADARTGTLYVCLANDVMRLRIVESTVCCTAANRLQCTQVVEP